MSVEYNIKTDHHKNQNSPKYNDFLRIFFMYLTIEGFLFESFGVGGRNNEHEKYQKGEDIKRQ